MKNFEGMRGFDRVDNETSEDEDRIEASYRLVHLESYDNNYERSKSFSSS